jgi:hypothetical protein
MAPNALLRGGSTGVIESFRCPGGDQPDPVDVQRPPLVGPPTEPPCFTQPPSLYNGKQFVVPQRGRAPKVDPPAGLQGSRPARDPHPSDPLR